MKRTLNFFLILALFTAGCAQTPRTQYQNPILHSNFPDPFLLKVKDTWYAYATNGSGRNVQRATSRDLVHWEIKPDAMPLLAPWIQRASSDVWAPEVIFTAGQYVLYYTAREQQSGKQCIGVAVSDDPAGIFVDKNRQPIVCQRDLGGSIDPDPFRDGNKLYLFFKNDGNCCRMATSIYVQELARDGLSVKGQPKALLSNDAPWEGSVIEAPTMYKHAGRYYLFFSANSYDRPSYAVGYAICQNVTGPCQDAAENPILSSRMKEEPVVMGPGHQAIVEINQQTWIVYHAWEMQDSLRRTERRFLYVDRLEWKERKPVVDGPTTDVQTIP